MCMRTTLTVDDDVLFAARERARRERRSVGDVISELARRGLVGEAAGRGLGSTTEERHGFAPLPPRGQAVSNDLIDRLLDDEPE